MWILNSIFVLGSSAEIGRFSLFICLMKKRTWILIGSKIILEALVVISHEHSLMVLICFSYFCEILSVWLFFFVRHYSVLVELFIGFSCAVHGIEYAFGAHEYPTTGIFEGEPRKCDGFTFRKSILIGKTDVGPLEVRTVMEQLAEQYRGNAYNLITKNCNHFCNDACIRLTGNPIPNWVNRLARIGKNWSDFCIFIPTLMMFEMFHRNVKLLPNKL